MRRRLCGFRVVWTATIRPIASPRSSASLTKRSTWACKNRLVPNWMMGKDMALNLDDRLDYAGFRLDPFGKPRRRLFERRAVSGESVGRCESFADRADGFVEILSRRVAAA